MTITADFEEELLGLTQAIPGVLRLYPAKSVIHTIVAKAAAAVMQQPVPLLISIDDTDGRLEIALTIGLTGTAPAADFCREVYDVLAEHLRQRLQPAASIRILIAHIG